jgi:hypothetical protein
MGTKELIAVIDARLAQIPLSRHRASVAAGHKDCIRNWARGKSNPQYGTLSDLAKGLELDPQILWAIYKGEEPPPSRDMAQRMNDMESLLGKVAEAVLGRKTKLR